MIVRARSDLRSPAILLCSSRPARPTHRPARAGFVFASLIMARCSSLGHDRLRSAYMLIPWLVAAELAIYACGLFWMPFGMAIRRGVSPSAICPSDKGAGSCLNNIFNWGMVPFIPGEIFKMALVLVTLPLAWQATLAVARWRNHERLVAAASEKHDLLKPLSLNEAAGTAVPAETALGSGKQLGAARTSTESTDAEAPAPAPTGVPQWS